jgi:hypothetical protein
MTTQIGNYLKERIDILFSPFPVNYLVEIKYPEMVAEMVPHFEGNEIPDFGKDNLWFL